jgi:hypothetical protein
LGRETDRRCPDGQTGIPNAVSVNDLPFGRLEDARKKREMTWGEVGRFCGGVPNYTRGEWQLGMKE